MFSFQSSFYESFARFNTLYFSAYLPISSLTVDIFKSVRISSFLTSHGALTIVLGIFGCSDSSSDSHSGISCIQIDFIIVLCIFNLFSMLSLELRLVNSLTYNYGHSA